LGWISSSSPSRSLVPNNRLSLQKKELCSVSDPHWLYADPDPAL
jgi:hypothetical protein